MGLDDLRAVLRGTSFLALTALVLLLHPALAPLGSAPAAALRRLWCRAVCLLLGIRLERSGEPYRGCATLYVANHVSYLDIPALGAFLDATFIAKAEVAGWPLLGLLARRAGTMFVRRHWRQALIQRNALAARMRAGESFVLFGEGTSTDGTSVRPLKTSLLSVAEPWVIDQPVAVQPVTLVFRRLADGTPIDRDNAHLYGWWGDMELVPHLWNVMRRPGLVLEVRLGAPVLSWSVASRKELGRALRQEIEGTLIRARTAPAEPVAQVAGAFS